MEGNRVLIPAHPQGEVESGDRDQNLVDRGKAVETFGGKVFVRWDADAAVTAFAPVTYFLEFLKANGLWQQWVEDCPLNYRSGNAPPKQDILGTLLLSVLAGHKRYAHVTTVRSDSVLPGLLGMERVRSEDAVRRAFLKGEGAEYAGWLHAHLDSSYEELLKEPWILDMDGTVKPLYGSQEQAVRLFGRTDWAPAGGGWQGLSSELQLTGWSRKRRVVVLRRVIRESLAITAEGDARGQGELFATMEVLRAGNVYEYAVLVTPLEEEVLGIAQLYRDRAEAENVFDELKDQWGWAGFTTQDHQRCQILARIVALIYNWWSLFTRLAIPNRHTEATTSRPLLLHGIGRQTTHGNQTTLTITSNHAHAEPIRRALEGVSRLLRRLVETAEQFTVNQRWRWLLRFIFRDWLKRCAPDPRFLPLTALVNCRI